MLNEEKCPHHWIIAPASGPTSKGVCRLCGRERDGFKNYTEGSPWGDMGAMGRTHRIPPAPQRGNHSSHRLGHQDDPDPGDLEDDPITP